MSLEQLVVGRVERELLRGRKGGERDATSRRGLEGGRSDGGSGKGGSGGCRFGVGVASNQPFPALADDVGLAAACDTLADDGSDWSSAAMVLWSTLETLPQGGHRLLISWGSTYQQRSYRPSRRPTSRLQSSSASAAASCPTRQSQPWRRQPRKQEQREHR